MAEPINIFEHEVPADLLPADPVESEVEALVEAPTEELMAADTAPILAVQGAAQAGKIPVLDSIKYNKANRDLNIERLAIAIAQERDAAFRRDPALARMQVDRGELPFYFDKVLEDNQHWLGDIDEYNEAMALQGFDPSVLLSEVGMKGRPTRKVIDELKAQNTTALKTPQQRKVEARGLLIKKQGIEKLEREGEVVPEELSMSRTYEYRIPTFEGDDIDEEAAVVKEGSKPYQDLEKLWQRIFDPDTERGQTYITALDDANGNMFNESGLHDFQEAIAVYETTEWMKRQQEAGKDITPLSAQYDQELDRQRAKALKVAAMARTLNRWTAPQLISWDKVTGLRPPDDSDDSWLQRAWRRGSQVRLELVGLDEKNVPVYRLTSPVWHIFEMSDSLQSAVVGGIDAYDKWASGPDEKSFDELLDAMSEGTLEGIERRRHLLEYAMASEFAKDSTAGAWVMGGVGLVGTVVFPDLLVGAGALARLSKRVAAGTSRVTKAGRTLRGTVDSLGTGAKDGMKAAETMDAVARAIDEGDLDTAEQLLTTAARQMKKAESSEQAVRRKALYAAQNVDEAEFQIHLRQRKNVPEISLKEGRKLADQIPGAFGHRKQNISPSVRKGLIRNEEHQQLGTFPDFYNQSEGISNLLESLRMIRAGDVQFTGRITRRVIGPTRDNLVRQLDDIGISRAKLIDDPDKAKPVTALTDYLDDYDATLTLIRDPELWARNVRELAEDLPLRRDQVDKWLGVVQGDERRGGIINNLISKIRSDVEKATKVTQKILPDEATMLKAVTRAARAIETNIEARSTAMVLIREMIAAERGIKAAPILVEAANKYRYVKELSPEAQRYRDQIQAAFDFSEEEATAAARVLDLAADRWAERTKREASEYFAETFKDKAFQDKAAFMRRLFKPPPPYVAEDVAAASLPSGYRVEKDGALWKVLDENDEVIGSAAEPLDAAGKAIDELVNLGVMTRHEFDESATRVGPLLLGQPMSVAENAIRRLNIEYAMVSTDDGVHILRKTSNAPNYVSFTTDETLRMMKTPNVKFTHNHPNGSAFSGADMMYGSRLDARQMRATQPNGGVWTLDVPNGFGDFSDAVLIEKYGSPGAIPVAANAAKRAFYADIERATNEAVRFASEQVRRLHGQEVLDRTGAENKWGAFYSEALLGTPDANGVLRGGRLQEVFDSRGIEHTFTRLEPDETGVRVGPRDEPTFGETARRAAAEQDLDIFFQAIDGKNPIFYSRLEQLVQEMPPKVGLNDVVRFLSGRGAKADEIKWTNVQEFLDDAAAQGKKSITKEELLKHLNDNRIIIEDTQIGPLYPNQKFGYFDDARYDAIQAGEVPRPAFPTRVLPGGTVEYREVKLRLPQPKGSQFIVPHWDEADILVFFRATTRRDTQGRRILFIEEIQSDWHQVGRKHGYGAVPIPGAGKLKFQIPDAPFKDTKAWTGLAVKRIMRMAADEGFDGVAFTRGDAVTSIPGISLPKKSAQEYYDKIVPSVVKKHTKAPLGKTRLAGPAEVEGVDFNFVELTPEVKKQVGGPQFLFQRTAPRQTGWEMKELADRSVELTSAGIRAADGAGLTFKVEGDVLRVQTVELPEALRGQGIGQELYLRAMEHAKSIGKGFESDIAPSPDAIATYERLIEAGVPLTRKTVEAADGKMVQQFVATADDLAGASLDVAPRGGRVLASEPAANTRQAVETLTAEAEAEGIDKLRRTIQDLPEDAEEARDTFKKQFRELFGTYRRQTGYGAENIYVEGHWLHKYNAEKVRETLAQVAAGGASPEQYRLLKYLHDNPDKLAKVAGDNDTAYNISGLLSSIEKRTTEVIVDAYEIAQAYGIKGVTVDDILSGRFADMAEKAGVPRSESGVALYWIDSIRSKAKKVQKYLDDADVDFTYKFDAPSRAMIVNTLIGKYELSLFRAMKEGRALPPAPNLEIFLTPARKKALPRKGAGYDTFGAGAEEDYARFVAEGDRSITLDRLFEGVEAVPTRPAMGVVEPEDVGKFVPSPAGTPKKDLKWYERAEARKRGRGQILRQTLRTRDKLGKAWKTDSGIATISDHEYDIVKEFVAMVGTKRLENVAFAIEPKIRTGMMVNEPLGLYFFGKDIVGISHSAIASGRFVDTTIHELWHGLSQYLPTDTVQDLYKQFARERGQFMRTNPGAFDRAGKLIDINMAKNQSTYRFSSFDEWVVEKMKDLSIEDASRRLLSKGKGVDSADPLYAKPWQKALRALSDLVQSHYNQIKAVLGQDVARKTYLDFMRGKYVDQVRDTPLAAAIKITSDDEARAAQRWSEYLDALDAKKGVLDAAVRMSDETEKFLEAMITGPAKTVTPQEFRALASEAPRTRRAPGEAPTDPRILKQDVDDEIRGATEFFDDGRAVIYALNKPTFATFIHEMGHVMRRDLDEKQMDVIAKWLNETEGVSVAVKGARFDGTAEAVVEAEEKFARAFEEYIRTGKTPQPKLKKVFQQMKDWLVEFYGKVRGLDVTMTPEVRKVFDEMLGNEPARRPLLKSTLKLIKDELTGKALKDKSIQIKTLDEISRETRKLGHEISVDDMKEQLSNSAKADAEARGVPLEEGKGKVILPGPVYMAGRYPQGKTEFTLTELTDLYVDMLTKARMARGPGPRLALRARAKAVQEMTPTQIIDNIVASDEGAGVKKWVRNMFLGGDAFEDMRNVPQEIRFAANAAGRRVEQAIGDSITLVGEGDLTKTMKYLTGETVAFSDSGRSAISSGHDMMGSVVLQLRRFFDPNRGPLTSEEVGALTDFVESIHVRRTAVEFIENKQKNALVVSAISKMTSKSSSSPFIQDVLAAAGVRSGQLKPEIFGKAGTPGQPIGLLEALMYAAGVSRRPPENIGRRAVTRDDLTLSPASERMNTAEVFSDLYRDLRSPSLFKGNPQVANRVVILIAGHGTADKAMKLWSEMGITVDAASAAAFKKWMSGEALADEAEMGRVLQMYQVHGFSPSYVQGMDLYGMNTYVPAVARQRLAKALARATDPTVAPKLGGDFLEAIGGGEAAAQTGTQMMLAWGYRYQKTRMVRGHFVIKSRYFTMNTFDHFNQMALVAGFRPGFASMLRMLPQNALSNPLGQAIVLAARTVGYKKAGEDVRKLLQKGGEKASRFASKILMGSKWRLDLNDVLEGRDRIFQLGPNAIDAKGLRDIMLEEGIFSSFDTSQLGIKVRKSLEMYAQEANQASSTVAIKVKDAIASPAKVAADIAEAWSERERAGAVMTLMEMGIDPRTACRIVIEGLYDYAGSMSKFDRHWIINMVLPFWAFQKNVNRQTFDAVFSARGAYRLGVMRRAYDRGTELISNMMYEDLVDPYGIDVESMKELEPALYDAYWNMKRELVDYYGSPEDVPDEVHREVMLWLNGAQAGHALSNGSTYTSDELKRKLMKYSTRFQEYSVPRPKMESRRTYRRIRPGIAVPHAYTKNAKAFIDGIRQTTPDTPYTFVMLPEPAYQAAFHHMSYTAAAMILMGKDLVEGPASLVTESDGTEPLTNSFATLAEVFAPQKAPAASELFASMGLEKAAYPQRLHPSLVKMAEAHGVEVFPTTPVEDPFATEEERKKALEEAREARVEAGIIKQKRYYMSPGMARLVFVNNPIGELNSLLLKKEKTPLQAATLEGEIIKWAEDYVGLDVEEVYGTRTTASERRRAREEGDAEAVYKKAQKGRQKRYRD